MEKAYPSSLIAFGMEKAHPPPVWYGNDVTRWSRDVWGTAGEKKPRGIGGQRARAAAAAAAGGARGIGGGGGARGGWCVRLSAHT